MLAILSHCNNASNETEKEPAMFKVIYANHDRGSSGGTMIRDSIERAEWSAELMRQCGYRDVRIEKV